ncbi:four helix bundle protein [bacterium]|nr:four helix bundle protein [bacterium]
MSKNIIKDKSYNFALRIVKLYSFLQKKQEFVLSKQIIRSGTSIGANVEEASAAQSKKDFIFKMSIASKEARESNYWLRLLRDSKLVSRERIQLLIDESNEILRLLTSIVKTSEENSKRKAKNLLS